MTPLRRAYIGFAIIGASVIAAFAYEQYSGQSIRTLLQPLPFSARKNVTADTTHTMPSTLPTFTLKDLNGQPQSSTQWQGKPLVVNFWASWCQPCRREIPLLNQLAQQPSLPSTQVVGIAIDFTEDVQKFAKDTPIQYPVLIGEDDGVELARQFGVEALAFPFTVFVDSHGNLLALRMGELHPDQLTKTLKLMGDEENHSLSLNEARQQIAAVLSQAAAPASE